jgi:hypothetical protein
MVKDMVLSEDSDLVFFLKDRGLSYTVESHYLYKITRLLCPQCLTRHRNDYSYSSSSYDERRYGEGVYSNIMGHEFYPKSIHVIYRINKFYDHMYQQHGYFIHDKEENNHRDIIVKILQQLRIFAQTFKTNMRTKNKDAILERKIKLGQCIRFLNKDCGIPIDVIVFCFNMDKKVLGMYAYEYMKHKEGLPNWAKNF